MWEKCPICQSNDYSVFFSWPEAVVQQQFVMRSRRAAQHSQRGKIELALCRVCGTIWNRTFDPKLLKYSEPYEATQIGSPAFRKYLSDIAKHLVRKYRLQSKNIVEIGCGDAYFLKLICKIGHNHGVGFEPSWRKRTSLKTREDITIIPDYFSEKLSAVFRPDLIACRHVLEHVEDPPRFLKSLLTTEHANGSVLFFEVPNISWSLRHAAFWDIYYEHSLYFCEASLRYLFQSCGMRVTKSATGFGGQYVLIESQLGLTSPRSKPRVSKIATELVREVRMFQSRYHKMVKLVERQRSLSKKQRTVIWGAGAKCVALLNFLQVKPDQIEYVVDINSRKWGTFVPGTGQEIVPPKFLSKFRPEVVFVMNPKYLNEIRAALRRLRLPAKLKTIGSSGDHGL